MELWIDAQLSPSLALWINQNFPDIQASSLRAIGLRDASDKEIFEKAKASKVILMSKDDDFIRLLEKHGPPPQIIWITCGNTSNQIMREILSKHFATLIALLKNGEPFIEIDGK